MCELCKIVESANKKGESEQAIHYSDGLCVIADSLGDKPTKDKDGKTFQPKVVIYRQHQEEPLPPIKDAIIQTAKRVFRGRKLWFPSTTDNTEKGKRLPLSELSAHWYFIIE